MISNTQIVIMPETNVKDGVFTTTEISVGQQYAKRGFDILFSIFSLFLLLPVFAVIVIIQIFTSKESIFFFQERIGLGGKPFLIFKFRTMREDAEENEPQLANEKEAHKYTKIGLFLRRTHLDELPQLWNVLKGDMSFVGYRPERQYFIDRILEHDSRYVELYKMRPGITSEAAIYNGYTDTMEKMLLRLEMDLAYMSKSSIKTDVIILFKTIGMFF